MVATETSGTLADGRWQLNPVTLAIDQAAITDGIAHAGRPRMGAAVDDRLTSRSDLHAQSALEFQDELLKNRAAF